MQDILARLANTSSNESSHELQCRCFDAAEEISMLRATEEGAKESFGVLVQQKQDAEAECKRLRGLLDRAHADIRKLVLTHNV
jgi:hypothetical protein